MTTSLPPPRFSQADRPRRRRRRLSLAFLPVSSLTRRAPAAAPRPTSPPPTPPGPPPGTQPSPSSPATSAPCRATTTPSWSKAAPTPASGWSAPRRKARSTARCRSTSPRPHGQPTPLETARANHMAFFAQQKARRPAPRLHQARRQGRHRRRLRPDPDGRPHRRHRLGHLPAHRLKDQELLDHRLQLLLPLGRLAPPVPRHPQDRPLRRLLHLRHRHGQLPPLEWRPQPMPRRRRPHVPSRSPACRASAPTSPPPSTAAASPSPPWPTPSASPTTKPAG